jgi:hypothetical protein
MHVAVVRHYENINELATAWAGARRVRDCVHRQFGPSHAATEERADPDTPPQRGRTRIPSSTLSVGLRMTSSSGFKPSTTSASRPLFWPICTGCSAARPCCIRKTAHPPRSRNKAPAGILTTSSASQMTIRASTRKASPSRVPHRHQIDGSAPHPLEKEGQVIIHGGCQCRFALWTCRSRASLWPLLASVRDGWSSLRFQG